MHASNYGCSRVFTALTVPKWWTACEWQPIETAQNNVWCSLWLFLKHQLWKSHTLPLYGFAEMDCFWICIHLKKVIYTVHPYSKKCENFHFWVEYSFKVLKKDTVVDTKVGTVIQQFIFLLHLWIRSYFSHNSLQVPVWFCILLFTVPWAGKGCADPCASLRKPGKPRETGTTTPDHHPRSVTPAGQLCTHNLRVRGQHTGRKHPP